MTGLMFAMALLGACSTRGRVVEYRTNFIDMEFSNQRVQVICEGSPSEEVSFFGVYGALDRVLYNFFFRSPVQGWKECLEIKDEYEHLIRKAKLVRVIGVGPIEGQVSKLVDPEILTSLGPFKKEVVATFIRMEGAGLCLSYFEGDCDPKEYWGGVIPGEPVKP